MKSVLTKTLERLSIRGLVGAFRVRGSRLNRAEAAVELVMIATVERLLPSPPRGIVFEITDRWQVMRGSAPQDMMNEPDKYNWDGSLKELIMPEDLDENEHIERLKEQAKMIGLPWQYMHGSGPPEMMDKPHRYNWDGSLKPPPEEPCEWCERYGDDCYCGTDKRHYGEHDYGNMLIGTVKSVDSVTRCVVISNCVSSPGNGVGYDLDPAIELTVVMKPRIKLLISIK